MVFALVAWLLLPDDGFGKPLWAYVLFVVSFDVAHVWSTGWLTWFDREAFARRRRLLTWAPPAAFALSFCLHLASPVVFWTLLAWVAITHFAKQQVGFIALYRARRGERDPVDRRLDRLALYTGAFGPVALWHADPTEIFDWFDAGEQFVVRLPPSIAPAIHGLMVAVALVWLGRQVVRARAGRAINPAVVVWMIAAWFTWWMGTRVASNFFVAAAFLNLFHGIPYVALVWLRVRANPAVWSRNDGLVGRLSRPGGALVFYGVVLTLAVAEELLWDAMVWHDFAPDAVTRWFADPSAWLAAAFVAALSLPQVVHYGLDAVLWRRAPGNADLGHLVRHGRQPLG